MRVVIKDVATNRAITNRGRMGIRGSERGKSPDTVGKQRSDGLVVSTESRSVDAFPENSTPEGVIGLVDYVVGEWCSDFYGVRYSSSDTADPKGPSKDQLPVKSDLEWLATVNGEYHVLRGRVKHSNWSTTSRNLGDRADDAGIYGFRIVVEADREE